MNFYHHSTFSHNYFRKKKLILLKINPFQNKINNKYITKIKFCISQNSSIFIWSHLQIYYECKTIKILHILRIKLIKVKVKNIIIWVINTIFQNFTIINILGIIFWKVISFLKFGFVPLSLFNQFGLFTKKKNSNKSLNI